MKITALLLLMLTGCCAMKYPLDGKAQSWCERRHRAERLCSEHGGVKDLSFGKSTCADGSTVCVDFCK